jgi:hypothetical protein
MARAVEVGRSEEWRLWLAVTQSFPALPSFNVPGAFYGGLSAGAKSLAKAPHLRFTGYPNTLRALTHKPGLIFWSAIQNRCKAIHMFGRQQSQAGLRLSSKKIQMVGAPPACCLTLRSRGRPNGMAHWPSSAGPCGPFCACCPVRHAVGLPLNSNVRRHVSCFRPHAL